MKLQVYVVLLGLTCSAAICSPHRPALVVPDAELAGISVDDRAQVDAKTAILKASEAAHAAQTLALVAVDRELKIAALAIDRDRAALEIAALQFQAAQETKNADQMLPAKKAREDAKAQHEQALAVQKYWDAKRDYVEQLLVVGEAEIAVAKAVLEQTKYEAATRTKGPDAARLAEFKSQVATAEAELAKSQVPAAKAKTDMEALRPKAARDDVSAPLPPAGAASAPAAQPSP